jgi:parallel beta-helix repeat protein
VDIRTIGELESATRGEDARSGDAPGTCYFIHDGTYVQRDRLAFYVRRGGAEGAPRQFVGESRDHVVVVGRATVDAEVSHVVIRNLTFTLSGYRQDGSFSTLTLGNGSDITVDHVTLTGDCATGYRGGHIETGRTRSLRVESCLVEKFGHCSGGGSLDHGIYLTSGQDITLRNNVVRGNSSRGIQLYTAGGQSGTLNNIVIENNRIYANGHGDYQDGVVVNGSDSGTIGHVTIQRNLIYRNAYSGIRFAGPATSGIQVVRNTFVENGVGSTRGSRSEINIDDPGEAAGAVISRNIFAVGYNLINNCYDAASLGFALRDNLADGAVPHGAAGDCISETFIADPEFYDKAAGDLRTRNPAAASYGAYAP